MHYERLQRLVIEQAMPAGATQIAPTIWEWDLQSSCTDPFSRTIHSRRDYDLAEKGFRTNPGTLTLHMLGIPCRKCSKCRLIRAINWRNRIRAELEFWPRTWFCTYTFRPDVHFHMHMRHLTKKNRAGWLDSDFTPENEYRLRCEAAGEQFTTYLKRVRKPLQGEGPVRLRYLQVFEPHTKQLAGLPHIHALVHEVAGDVTYRRIMERWTLGHCTAKLVSNELAAARYVSKYISKGELATRVRASQHYGEAGIPSIDAVLET